MIQELKEMMIERLSMYRRQSKCLPDRVFVYRDGVSEVRHPAKFYVAP